MWLRNDAIPPYNNRVLRERSVALPLLYRTRDGRTGSVGSQHAAKAAGAGKPNPNVANEGRPLIEGGILLTCELQIGVQVFCLTGWAGAGEGPVKEGLSICVAVVRLEE